MSEIENTEIQDIEQQDVQQPETVEEDISAIKASLEQEKDLRRKAELRAEQNDQRINFLIQSATQVAQKDQKRDRVPDFLTENAEWQEYLMQQVAGKFDADWRMRVAAAEEEIREDHPDYDDIVDNYFKPAMQQDTTLQHKLRSAPNPATYAYKVGLKLKDKANPDDLKARLKKEILSELGIKDGVKLPEKLGGGSAAPSGHSTRESIVELYKVRRHG